MLNIQGFLAENCEQSFTAILFPKRFSLQAWEDVAFPVKTHELHMSNEHSGPLHSETHGAYTSLNQSVIL